MILEGSGLVVKAFRYSQGKPGVKEKYLLMLQNVAPFIFIFVLFVYLVAIVEYIM